MAQKFLSIKNFEKYQHFNKAMPPWIKLYRSMFGDRDFMLLSITSRYLYIGLIMLASEGCNRIANDPSWIAQKLSISPSDIDLKPLYRSGLLIASESSVRRYTVETETETEKSRVESAVAPTLKVVPKSSAYPDGFAFDERADGLARSYGLNPHKELAAFRDHHVAKGSIFKDWQAAYRNWLRNAVKFAAKGAR